MKTLKINIKEYDGDTYYFATIYENGKRSNLIGITPSQFVHDLKVIHEIDLEKENFESELQEVLSENEIEEPKISFMEWIFGQANRIFKTNPKLKPTKY